MSAFAKEYKYYLRLIALRKELFIAVALLVMTAAVVVSYVLPKSYEVKTTIFIEQNVISDLVKGIAVSPSAQAKIKTLTVTLTSRNLLLQVLKNLDKDLSFENTAALEAYIKDMQQRIMVNLNERQGVFTISVRDPNPAYARDFANAMARAYIERNTSTKREESVEASSFLNDQLGTLKKRVDAAEEAINRFRSENGLTLTNDDGYIRNEIRAAEKKLEEISARRDELSGKWNILGSGGAGASAGGKAKQASDPQAELNRLLSIYTEKHPKVIAARAALQASRGGAPATGEGAQKANPTGKLVQLELDALKTMEERQKRIIEDNLALMREMPRLRASLADLMARRDQEANIYNQLVVRMGQSELSKQMELQDKSTMFRVVDPAVLPDRPTSPNRPLIILLGMLGGLAVGAASVFLADHFNHSVRSLQEIKSLGIPVFAVIPRMSSEGEILRKAKKDRLILAAAGSYFTLILGVLVVEGLRTLGLVAVLRKAAHFIL